MSYTGRKGSEGEAGVVDFINQWFPFADQGVGSSRGKSKGQNDIGDVEGVPFTCIEVKNHADPVLGSLIRNAEWKATNSQRPVWFLVHKRAGFSGARAGFWSSVTTVEGFLKGFRPVRSGTDDPAFLLEQLQGLALEEASMVVEPTATFPGLALPKHRWQLAIHFRSWSQNHQVLREEVIADFGGTRMDTMQIPVVIFPRTGHWDQPDQWYVFMRLNGMARLLETVGILPQDEAEYAIDVPAED